MTDEVKRLIRVRSEKGKPSFKRQQLNHKKKLKDVWRRPRGLQSKQRRQYRAKGAHPTPGYGSPVAVRGLHPSGFEEVLVHNMAELEGIDAETQAARIGGSVGGKKRMMIQEAAEGLGIKVLNYKSISVPGAVVEEGEVTEDE